MGKVQSPHDTFVRGILADKVAASDYLKVPLPLFISENLDFETLTQTSESYISKQLRETFSDVVFSCKLKDADQYVKVSLLIEHKSYIDKYTPVQIGSYIFSGLQKQVANREKLSMIIPILFIMVKKSGITGIFQGFSIIPIHNGLNIFRIFRMFIITFGRCPIAN